MTHRPTVIPGARRQFFTLIEMLVVVAIITVLASMLLPGLQAARERSRRIACLSNEKQWSLGLFLFESDNERLPNFKAAQGTAATLEGSPLSNSTNSNCNVANNYVGHEDYAQYLYRYVGADIRSWPGSPQTSYVNNWKSNPITACPSASHNEYANPATTGYNDFYKGGSLRVFYNAAGMNWLWASNGLNWLPKRSTEQCSDATKVAMVTEPCLVAGTSAAGGNNHRGRGLNAIAMDGSGRWRDLTELRRDSSPDYSLGNRFGDSGQGLAYMPADLGQQPVEKGAMPRAMARSEGWVWG